MLQDFYEDYIDPRTQWQETAALDLAIEVVGKQYEKEAHDLEASE